MPLLGLTIPHTVQNLPEWTGPHEFRAFPACLVGTGLFPFECRPHALLPLILSVLLSWLHAPSWHTCAGLYLADLEPLCATLPPPHVSLDCQLHLLNSVTGPSQKPLRR